MDSLSDIWDVFANNTDLFRTGFGNTIKLFVIASIGSLVLGTFLAMLRVSPVPILRAAGTAYVTVLRNTPLTLVLFFFAFAYPLLDIVRLSFFVSACVGLTLYTAAFVCEVVRSGINTVNVGQAEAARALGFTFGQTLGTVVLPQAIRSVVPPLNSVQIALLKNTTVTGVFGVTEAFSRMRLFTNDFASARVGIFVGFALIFVLLVEIVSFGANRLERRWRIA